MAQPIATIEITIDRTGVSYRNVTVASRDSAAPSVGSAVISASLVTQNSVTLTWAPATDNSPVEGLKYKVYQSSEAANFESASEMEQHGVRVGGDISGSVLEYRNLAAGFPLSLGTQHRSVNDLLLSREQFVVSFNAESKVPVWTSWQLVANDLGSTERADSFQSDQMLNTFLR